MVTDYFDDLEFGLCLRSNALGKRESVRGFFSAVSRLGDCPAWVVPGVIPAVQFGGYAALFLPQTATTAAIGVALDPAPNVSWLGWSDACGYYLVSRCRLPR